MSALTPCVFVDQIFNCTMAMEAPPIEPPDPELISFGDETPPQPFTGPPPGLTLNSLDVLMPDGGPKEDVTKDIDTSFNMSTLVNTLDYTTVSSINSMVHEKGPDLKDFHDVQRSILFGLKRAMPLATALQLDAESAQYGAIFTAELPPEAVSFAPKSPGAKAGLVHERVREIEEMSKKDIKSEPCSAVASPSPPPDPNRTPDPHVKIEERDEIASYYSPTAYICPEFPENTAVDYYNSDRHPMVDGNNSDEEDYSAAEDLGAQDRYDQFISDINVAINQGTLAQGSPTKVSGKLFGNEDSREPSTHCWHPESGSSPLNIGTLESYEDHCWDLPAGILGDNEYAEGCTDTLMKEWGADTRAQHLHPKSLQQCSGSECDSISMSKVRGGSRASSPALSLYAPTPQRSSSFSFFIAPSGGTVLHTTPPEPEHSCDSNSSQLTESPDSAESCREHPSDNHLERNYTYDQDYLQYPGCDGEYSPDNQDALSELDNPPETNESNANDTNVSFSSATPEKQDDFLDIWDLVGNDQAVYDEAWNTPIKFRSESSNIDEETLDSLKTETCEVLTAQILDLLNSSAFTADLQEAPPGAGLPQANWSRSASSKFSAPPQTLTAPAIEDRQPSYLCAQELLQSIGQSLYLQNPISNATFGDPQGCDLPSAIFSDIPRPTVDRVISYRNLPEDLLPGASNEALDSRYESTLPYLNEDQFAQASLSEAFDSSFRNFSNFLPACDPFQPEVPRTYHTDPAYLDFFKSLLHTSDPPELFSEGNNDVQYPQCQELLSASQFQEQYPDELDFLNDTGPTQTDFNDDFMAQLLAEPPAQKQIQKPPRTKKASRVVPKHLKNYRVSKNKAKSATTTQMSVIVEEDLSQVISDHLNDNPLTQDIPQTVTISSKGKRQRKGKTTFDYQNAAVPQEVIYSPLLENYAVGTGCEEHSHADQLVCLNGTGECHINRTRYKRDSLDSLASLHPNVYYEKNLLFGIAHPYQQEFTRVELDPTTGLPRMETRSALCAYCEDLNFYELKNSCYSQHMSHSHGIYTDNYLAPNPLFNGRYKVSKKPSATRKTQPRMRFHEGVVCPACFEVVEIRCWSSTLEKKPLSNYLRHFKECHRVDKRKETFFDLST